MVKENIFNNIPQNLPAELIEIVTQSDRIRIERIISDGHISPPDFWYEQDQNEFVIVLRGNAVLEFENGKTFELNEGDFIIINAHEKHRVVKTDTRDKTIWLAIFYG